MRPFVTITVVLVVLAVVPGEALRVETLRSIGGLPPHIAGAFQEPVGLPAGSRRHLLRLRPPRPRGVRDRCRPQRVRNAGRHRSGGGPHHPAQRLRRRAATAASSWPTRRAAASAFRCSIRRARVRPASSCRASPRRRSSSDNLMLNGTGSVHFGGSRLLLSHPESGALVTAYTPAGYPTMTFGRLRPTGFESDRELHLAHNAGLPLADPTGGLLLRLHHRAADLPQVRRGRHAPLRAPHRGRRDRRAPRRAADRVAAPARRGSRGAVRRAGHPRRRRRARAASSGSRWPCRTPTSTTRRATRSAPCSSTAPALISPTSLSFGAQRHGCSSPPAATNSPSR